MAFDTSPALGYLLTKALYWAASNFRDRAQLKSRQMIILTSIMSFLIYLIAKRKYPSFPYLKDKLSRHLYVERIVEYLALIRHSHNVSAAFLFNQIKTYKVVLGTQLLSSLEERKPIAVCTIHRVDLIELIASLCLFLKDQTSPRRPRIVTIRGVPPSYQEALWIFALDLLGCDLVPLQTSRKDFSKVVAKESEVGSLFVFLFDNPKIRKTHTSKKQSLLGLNIESDYGFLYLAVRHKMTISSLNVLNNKISIEEVDYIQHRSTKTITSINNTLVARTNREFETERYKWLGWLDFVI